MKQFFYKKWIKLCAAILCIFSFNIMAGSFFIMLAGDRENLYNRSEAEFWEDAKESICNNYSVMAVANFRDDFGLEQLKDTNFRYGVIQADSIDGLNLNNKSIYKVCNFDQKVTEDMLYVHTYSLGNFTEFYVGKNLSDHFYVYNESQYREEKKVIEDIFYTWDTNDFYAKAGNSIYQVTPYVDVDYEVQERIEEVEMENGEVEYIWTDYYPEQMYDLETEDEFNPEQLYLNGQSWNLSDITIVTQKDLSKLGKNVSNDDFDSDYEEFWVENGYIVVNVLDVKDSDPYYVLSYVNEPLETKGNFFEKNIFGKIDTWKQQDFFVQSKSIIETFCSVRYAAFGMFLAFGLLFLLSFCALILGAGHRDSEKVTSGWFDKIPFDVFFVGVMCIFLGMLFIEEYCIYYMSIQIIIGFGVVLGLLAEVLAILSCMDAAIRFKMGKWWKNTVCYRICAAAARFLGQVIEKLNGAVPLIWKAWIVMAALALLELGGI